DLGQEGRAHRVRAHPAVERHRQHRRRPGHRAGGHGSVPLAPPLVSGVVGTVPRVAIPKICGVETEYGIIVRGAAESNPIAASSVLINAYVSELADSLDRGGARVG